MTTLDVELIRQFAKESTTDGPLHIDAFAEIDSTNSYLMQMPGPEPRKSHVAVTNNQTAGRGRHGDDPLHDPLRPRWAAGPLQPQRHRRRGGLGR